MNEINDNIELIKALREERPYWIQGETAMTDVWDWQTHKIQMICIALADLLQTAHEITEGQIEAYGAKEPEPSDDGEPSQKL